MQIRFYHLTRQPLEQALPALLQKTLQRNWRALVRTTSATRAAELSEALWAYDDIGFIPHGTLADGNASAQPVLLTATDDNPNNAQVIFLTDGIMQTALINTTPPPELLCILFSDFDSAAVTGARAAWQEYKTTGHTITYYQQADKGWVEKK